MNIERLTILADHLDTVPAERFDLGVWHRVTDCGTTACAVGHACAIPEFKAAGLQLVDSLTAWGFTAKRPFYKGEEALSAVMSFFDMDQCLAAFLLHEEFYPPQQRGAQDVAARIREVVAGAHDPEVIATQVWQYFAGNLQGDPQ